MSVDALVDALAGRFHRWWWSHGLSPDVVREALGVDLVTGPARLHGRALVQAVIRVDPQPYPVRLRWDETGELALAELSEPTADPSWDVVIECLGEPDGIIAAGSGPFPGSQQRCHLSRGLTVFDGSGLGYQAVWLYPPTTVGEYPLMTGALETPQRRRGER